MRSRHSGKFPTTQLPALAKASQQLVDRISPGDCPFCDVWAKKLSATNPKQSQNETLVITPAQFRHHVCAHMEQLALFAIPRGFDDGKNANLSEAAAGIGTDTFSDKNWETGSGASYEKEESSPVHFAAYEGLEAEVAQLLEDGADVNSVGQTWGLRY